jgi:methionyl aminopeptidase
MGMYKKSKHELNLMRAAGRIVAETLLTVKAAVRPGISTLELDQLAEAYIRSQGAIPTFKGYYGFTGTLCTSVNDEVVHGLPRADKILQEGDIISLDCGATYRGMIADSATTVPVGVISEQLVQLLARTQAGLMAGIAQMTPGNYVEDISGAVEDLCLAHGYGMVRNYGGHGVGRKLHEEPFIRNFRTGEPGPKLKEGFTLAIEPMYNLGGDDVYTADDQWTVLTVDHLPSAHFEHSVLVTDGEPEILTRVPN